MTRRAFHSPKNWKQNLLLTIAMGSAGVLLGCGGGGGGGTGGPPPGSGDCGSAAGAGTVVCGYVTNDSTGSGVNGVTVRLRNAAGTTLASGVTANDTNNTAGFYKITVPGGAVPVTISPDTPATGFHNRLFRFKSQVFDFGATATAGGPCVPAITVTAGKDTRLTDPLRLFTDSAPPPPFFGCPR